MLNFLDHLVIHWSEGPPILVEYSKFSFAKYLCAKPLAQAVDLRLA